MKKLLLITLLSTTFLSCNPPRTITEVSVPQVNVDKHATLSGKWTLVNYSAFMANLEEDRPKFVPGDFVWDFGKGGASGRVIISQNPKLKMEPIISSGTHRYWSRQCVLAIGDDLFLFSILGDKLVIDSNSDPRMSADGDVLTFERMK